jgi:gliding motility-associated-like protein
MIRILFIITCLNSIFFTQLDAQEFTKAYGNNDNSEFANGYFSISHNAYFVAGVTNTTTLTLTKIDRNGNVIWSKKYSGSYHFYVMNEIKIPGKNTTDVILTPCEYGTYENLYIMRIDGETGEIVWSKKYKYPSENRFADLFITSDQYIIASSTVRYNGGIFIVKVDYNGNTVWSKLMSGGDLQRLSEYTSDGNNGIVFGIKISSLYGIATLTQDGNIGYIKKSTNNLHFRNITKNPNGTYTLSGYQDWNDRAINHQLVLTDENFNIKWAKVLNPVNSTSSYCEGCGDIPSFMNNKGEVISIRQSAISGEIKNSYSKFSANGTHIKSVATINDDIAIYHSKYTALNTFLTIGKSTKPNICLPKSFNGFLSSLKDDLDICDTYEFTPNITNSNNTFVDVDKNIISVSNTNFTLTNVNTIVSNNVLKARNLCSNEEEKVNLGADISTCTSGNITLNAGTGYKSYQWSNGAATPTIQVNTSGNYWVKATDDCDRISRDTIKITISSPSTKNQSIAICSGKTYIVGQNTYRVAGNYKDTLISKNGCDSIINTTLTIKPNSTKVQSFAICQGDSVKVGNSIYKTAGTYTNTLTSSNSCDSIITTTITIKPISTKTQTFAICQGDSVKVGNSIYKTAGTFKDILTAKNGCDSIITTTITIKPISTKTQTFAICQGDSIKVGNSIYKTAGTFQDILTARNGCDSMITTILTINSKITQSISFSICLGDSIKVGNSIYKTAGTYKDTLTTPRGCDSIITTSLTIKPITTKSLNYSICQGDSVKVGNSIYKTAGTFKDILTAKNGCDSIITSVITIKPISTKTQTFTICQGDSVNVGNSIYKTAGTFIDILTAQNACDSIITSVIIITPTESQTVNYSLCKGDSIKLFGKSYSQEGIFNDTLTNIKGCDSIYLIIEITFSPTLKLDLGKDTILCDGEFLALGSNIQAEKYNWSNGSTQPTIEAEAPGTYSLTISNDCGSISDTIVLNAIDCDCSVFIPNAFSPNGDGKNDVLIIKEENIISSNFMIYNKWGMEVFTSKNNDQNWNGVNKDKQLPPDVYGYYYEGTCIKGNKMEYKGNITIVR